MKTEYKQDPEEEVSNQPMGTMILKNLEVVLKGKAHSHTILPTTRGSIVPLNFKTTMEFQFLTKFL